MEVTGTLKAKKDTRIINDSFKLREFVLTIDQDTEYPQYITFQLNNNKCALIDRVNVDDTLTVSFDLNGKEWVNPEGEKIYFNSFKVWKISSFKTRTFTKK